MRLCGLIAPVFLVCVLVLDAAALFTPRMIAPSHGIVIELCDGHGARTLRIDPQTGEEIPDEHATCPLCVLIATASWEPPAESPQGAGASRLEAQRQAQSLLSRPVTATPAIRAPPVVNS